MREDLVEPFSRDLFFGLTRPVSDKSVPERYLKVAVYDADADRKEIGNFEVVAVCHIALSRDSP